MSLNLPWAHDEAPALDRPGLSAGLGRTLARMLDPALGYRRRWRLGEALLGHEADADFAPIVVVGCGRSGTTLVSRLLDRHPLVFCGDESSVFLDRVSDPAVIAERFGLPSEEVAGLRLAATQPAFIRRFANRCLIEAGKPVWAEKTPENVRHLARIRHWFPKARLVHVIRDGRDVACSLRLQPWMKLGRSSHGDDAGALRSCLLYWQARAALSLAWREDPQSILLRYEDLVRAPEATLSHLMEALGLSPSPAQLAGLPIRTDALGRWRNELPARRLQGTLARIAPTLEAFGYDA